MGALRGSFLAANRSVPSTFLLYMYSAEESTAPSAFKEAEKKYQRHVQQISRKRYSADPNLAMHIIVPIERVAEGELMAGPTGRPEAIKSLL